MSVPSSSSAIPPTHLYSSTASAGPSRSLTTTPPPNASNPTSTTLTSTPILKKESGSHNYASQTHSRLSANNRLAEETWGLFLGSMPPRAFLDSFLPLAIGIECRPDVENSFEEVHKAKNEIQMIQPFIDAAESFAPGLKFVDTHANGDVRCDKLAPDVSVYSEDDPTDDDVVTDFSKMEFFVEMKSFHISDPFCDPDGPPDDTFCFELDTKECKAVRGQLASYAAAQTGCQFRTHTFSVFMCEKFARLIRWDRSGATVTRRFDYSTEPEILADFLWRYSHLNRLQRGYDTSVSPPLPVLDVVPSAIQQRLRGRNPNHQTFRKVMVADRADAKVEKLFIISFPPKFTSRSPFGRATRPMLAYDYERDKVVFLKDYWRADVGGSEKEGDIYAKLEKHNVPYIAPFGRGNDLRDHMTLTQTLRTEPWACWSKEMNTLRQYRMTLDVVARHLTSFRSSRELVSAIADAMEAHQQAYSQANILHRDISVGNILISDEGKGILIDWDLCLNLGSKNASPRRPDRTGTWQFMSVALLQDPEKYHELADDRESCLHVLTWTVLRYTKHTLSQKDLNRLLQSFDEAFEGSSGMKGGDLKRLVLTGREIPEKVTFADCPHLDKLIEDLTETFAVRYERRPSAEDMKLLEEVEKSNTNPFFIQSHATFKYKKHRDNLEAPNWLFETLRRHLNAGHWPKDPARARPIGTGSKTKRAREQSELESRMPSSKSRRYANA